MAIVGCLSLLIATWTFLGPAASACPTPPGACVEKVDDIIPDFSEDVPGQDHSIATNISFSVGSSTVWANVSSNASAKDTSGRLFIEVGAPNTVHITVFPSNETGDGNASVWVSPLDPSVYVTMAGFQAGALDLVNHTASVFEFGFLIGPDALLGEYELPVTVAIGNETGGGKVVVNAERTPERLDLLPFATFVGGLLLGVVLLAFMGRRVRGKRIAPKS